MNRFIGIGISTSTLILFLIIIGVGYVYVNETKYNTEQINGTLTKFIENWNLKQQVDNVRFNRTLNALAATYNEIVNGTNQTNSLVKFLSDNFGEQSDYLQKENYQYQQANKTYEYVKKALNNQEQLMIKHQLMGLKDHDVIIRLLNQSRK